MKNLYLYQDVLGFPIVFGAMRRYPGAAVRYVNGDEEVRPKPEADFADWLAGSLLLKQGRPPFIVPVPPGSRDTARQRLLLAEGLPVAHADLDTEDREALLPPTIHVNLPDYWRELGKVLPKSGPVCLGESLDVLHWCAHAGEARELLEAARACPEVVEAWTRGGEPAPQLAGAKAPSNLTFIVAMAPQEVLAAHDPDGAPLAARVDRAVELRRAGFRVELSLEPVRAVDGFREAYSELAWKLTRERSVVAAVRLGAPSWALASGGPPRGIEAPGEGWVEEEERACWHPRERYLFYREVFKAVNRRGPGSGMSRPAGGWSRLTILDRAEIAQQAQRPG